MKRLALLAAASASLSLFGCDSASTTSPDAGVQASVNNSDNRKASYTLATAEDRARQELKLSKILQLSAYQREGAVPSAAARLATETKIAYLVEPQYSFWTGEISNVDHRLFMHTETDGNADHVAPGSAWEVINHTVTPVSTRANPKWSYLSKYTMMLFHLQEQFTGIHGLRYAGVPVPPVPAWGGYMAYKWHNGTTPGLDLYWKTATLTSMPRLGFDYIVLRLSANCPEGGYPFSQLFDEEDINNQSGATFDLTPGWSGPGATGANLAFCFVPKLEGSTARVRDAFNNRYDKIGIFAAPPSAAVQAQADNGAQAFVNTIVVDAEDTDWTGQMIWEGMSPEFQQRVNAIMYPAPGSQTPYLSVLNVTQPIAVGLK